MPTAVLSPADLADALRSAGLLSDGLADQLAGLVDLPVDQLTTLAAALEAEVTRLIGTPDQPVDVDDAGLTAAQHLADGAALARGEVNRRRAHVAATARGTTPTAALPRRTSTVAARGQVAPRASTTGRVRSSLTAGGRPIADTDVTAVLAEGLRSTFGGGPGRSGLPPGGRLVLASYRAQYPEDRVLGGDVHSNRAKIDAVVGPQALVAAGGMCQPSDVQWGPFTVGPTTSRPLKEALPSFGVPHGGLRFLKPPTLADLQPGVGIWTNDNDIAAGDTVTPGDNPVKACVTLDCPTDDEVLVHAVTSCLRVGNMQLRFASEWTGQATETLAVAWARLAEQTLSNAMFADATAVTVAETLSATRDVLDAVDRAASAMRVRLRLTDGERLRVMAPSWLRGVIRTDLARQLPGSTPDRLATADDEVTRFFSVRGLAPVWTLDDETAWATQGAGALVGWPPTVKVLLFPEGTYLFLDGGTLDLGVTRDAAMVATNDAQLFSESFEAVAFVGQEATALTINLDPTGSTSAATDLNAP